MLQLWGYETCHNPLFSYGVVMLVHPPNWRPSFGSWLGLRIQYIHSFPPYLGAVSSIWNLRTWYRYTYWKRRRRRI